MRLHIGKHAGCGIPTSLLLGLLIALPVNLHAAEHPPQLASLLGRYCFDCHDDSSKESGLDLTSLDFDLEHRVNRDCWILIHDRIEKREMPPVAEDLPDVKRVALINALRKSIGAADRAEIKSQGRGPMRRLNRFEFEQNLRDLLQLPHLDIRDRLPYDRESQHCDKVTTALDMSRVQLTAYLDATEEALRQAMVTSKTAPRVTKIRVVGRQLGPRRIAGGIQSMFYVRDSRGVDVDENNSSVVSDEDDDPSLELALFRSPGWPYSVFPRDTIAKVTGEYRVRFSARAVLQMEGFVVKPSTYSVPMMFRARKPTDHDIAEEVRPASGIIDVHSGGRVYETSVYLQAGQTIEYGLLGLPAPQIDAQGKTGYYRYPPLPVDGQPGVAFQWLEMEGPISPVTWPPVSHRVLFDDLGAEVAATDPQQDAKRLLRRFIRIAAREPVADKAMVPFENLVFRELKNGETLAEALLTGYQAFLCSNLFLYLREPMGGDHFSLANRLSHFLTNSRPDADLSSLAREENLRDPETLHAQTRRLIASDGFDRFVTQFTDSWLSLRELRRDDPDIRLYPEYRLDDYLIESIENETRSFFATMIRSNLSARSLVDADFTFVNDRLARHYGLPEVKGSALRPVNLPDGSPYGGLLTQASVLKLSANGTSTSPVVRGAWMMDRLIGQPPPPPPPGVPAVEPDIRGVTTIRELITRHTHSKKCAKCHAQFDPVGLALENFDVLGAWRTHYRGLGEGTSVTGIDRAGHDFNYKIAAFVDASGQLVDGRCFDSIHELKSLLLTDSRQLARNLLQQFTVYATGTPVRFGDRAEVEAMLDACAKDGYRVRDIILELVCSEVFLGVDG